MAKRLVDYYPMIKGQSSNTHEETLKCQKSKEGHRTRQDTEVSSDISTTDDVYDGDSSASTIILEHSPISPMGIPVLDLSTRASTPLQSQDTSDETCFLGKPRDTCSTLHGAQVAVAFSSLTLLLLDRTGPTVTPTELSPWLGETIFGLLISAHNPLQKGK
ncbi:hypothetical protein D9C73_024471 [Collichthys lucidus]|uniref:Uncharacterized protein n=1 Tax=Collichthys lucidus TaxID=240159 RepID=A0A4U5VPP4_COLLU|nr:hypothetical protein D9C73_024471 [Collichthys lucidus]